MKTKNNLFQICLLCVLVFKMFSALAQPVITQQPTNQLVLGGSSANFGVSVNGAGPFSYIWQLNGTNLSPNGNLTLISTVAGNGNASFSGDYGVATNATLNSPVGVAVDTSGNLFIADVNNHRIRKVDANGTISTVAGNGITGYSGDGGAATNATFYSLSGVVADVSGNIFVTDLGNGGIGNIRKVGANGIITTVAGNGQLGYSGDGGAATNAALWSPQGLAMDSNNNLYIADTGNNRIRKIGTDGIITTIAGTGQIGYSGDGGAATNAVLKGPQGLVTDTTGNIYISDTYNSRIRKVGANGIITTVAGNGQSGYSGDGGLAANSILFRPNGIAADVYGNIYFSDGNNFRIRRIIF